MTNYRRINLEEDKYSVERECDMCGENQYLSEDTLGVRVLICESCSNKILYNNCFNSKYRSV